MMKEFFSIMFNLQTHDIAYNIYTKFWLLSG